MGNIPQALGRALGTGAAQGHAILIPHHRGAALRAYGGHGKGHCIRRALGLVDRQHLRDDLPRLLQQHRIADAQIQPVDIILIVQCGGGNGGPSQAHRLHNDLGRQNAGTAYLDDNVQHPALFFLRRVLEGHSPAGGLCRAAQGSALA